MTRSLTIVGTVLAFALLTLFLAIRKPVAMPLQHHANAPGDGGPFIAWKFSADGAMFSSVTLAADGTVYGASTKGVYAISPDGRLKWHTQYGGSSYTALGSDGVLYAASAYGFIFGISPDGTVGWKPGYGLAGFKAPPAISGSTVLFANNMSDLYAFEEGSATEEWSQSTFREGAIAENVSLPGRAMASMTSTASPAVYSDDSIALPRQHWLNLFGSDGSPTWNLQLTSGTLGAAALGDDGTIYVGDGQTLYAVDHSGSLKWQFKAPAGGCCLGSPVVDADGTIYFAGGHSVFALLTDGTVKWSVTTKHQFQTSPTLAADGTLYIGAIREVVALNPDGSEKWVVTAPDSITAPSIGPDGTAYYVCGYAWICAIRGISEPLMKSAWPEIHHDPANSGNVLTQY